MAKEKRIQDIFENHAEVQNCENIQCDNCEERVLFHLRDSEGHDFAVGLTTVLKCVEFAIQNGDLPKLPFSWISKVHKEYDIPVYEDTIYDDYRDENFHYADEC